MRHFICRVEPLEISMLGKPSVMAAVEEFNRRVKEYGTGVLQYSVKQINASLINYDDDTIRVMWQDNSEHRMIIFQLFGESWIGIDLVKYNQDDTWGFIGASSANDDIWKRVE